MSARNVYLATLCLVAIAFPASAQQPLESTMTGTPEAFARAWLEAWNSQNVDRILAFYTDDAVYEDVPTVENGWGEPSRGRPMIRKSLQSTFEDMPDLGLDFVSASGTGDRMVVEWIMTGTRYRDHIGEFAVRGVSIVTLEGGRIASVSDYYDAYDLLSHLGMLPALDTEQLETGSHATSGSGDRGDDGGGHDR